MSSFFSKRQYPWPSSGNYFLADFIPWSITADAMKAYMYARNVRIACVLYCSRHSQLKKILIRISRGYCLSEKKKTELKVSIR
jgi:hypothetical protein